MNQATTTNNTLDVAVAREDLRQAYHALCDLRRGFGDDERRAAKIERSIEALARAMMGEGPFLQSLREANVCSAHRFLRQQIRSLTLKSGILSAIGTVLLVSLPFYRTPWGPGLAMISFGGVLAFIGLFRLHTAVYGLAAIARIADVVRLMSESDDVVVLHE